MRLRAPSNSAEKSLNLDYEDLRAEWVTSACQIFNQSAFQKTVLDSSRSLGTPWASIVIVSGATPEVFITVVWADSWSQYRVLVGNNNTIHLVQRGYDLEMLDRKFRFRNGVFDEKMLLEFLDNRSSDS
tara:strand:+ start:161 stop:547 length:387 start_codon:yes stop_codon:yes gene_type:complete